MARTFMIVSPIILDYDGRKSISTYPVLIGLRLPLLRSSVPGPSKTGDPNEMFAKALNSNLNMQLYIVLCIYGTTPTLLAGLNSPVRGPVAARTAEISHRLSFGSQLFAQITPLPSPRRCPGGSVHRESLDCPV